MSKKRLNANAVLLLRLLTEGKLLGRDLTSHQRKIVVKYHMEEMSHVSNRAVAELIGVTDIHVSRMRRELLRKGAWEIAEIDIKMIALELKHRKIEFMRQAVMQSNYGLAWAIECEYIKKLQELGFVYAAPQKHTVGTFELDVEEKLIELFKRSGVPNVSDFVAQLVSVESRPCDKKEARRVLARKSVS